MKQIFLGTQIFKAKISDTLVEKINEDMDKKIKTKKSISAVDRLVGKIKNEH